MAAGARDGREWSTRDFTAIRKDREVLGRPPTQEELYPLDLLGFGLFGVSSPAPLPKSSREDGFDLNKGSGA